MGTRSHNRHTHRNTQSEKFPVTQSAISKLNLSCWVDQQIPNRRQTLRSGDDLQPLPYINHPALISSTPSLPPPLTLISICFLSPPRPPPLRPVLSSSPPISLSSTPASPRQFQISAKATARRLDAYCCHRNRPSALDYNVTLSPCQGYNVCSL